MARMTAAHNIYHAIRGSDQAASMHRLSKWADANPSAFDLVRALRREGII